MVMSMIPNTITDKSGITITKMTADFTSTVNAMIMAPNTMNGERKNRRSTRFTPAWAWFTSLVIRVMSVELPSVSISVNVKLWICLNNACRTPVPNPDAAFAEKYWAVMEQTSPMMPSAIRTRHIFTM